MTVANETSWIIPTGIHLIRLARSVAIRFLAALSARFGCWQVLLVWSGEWKCCRGWRVDSWAITFRRMPPRQMKNNQGWENSYRWQRVGRCVTKSLREPRDWEATLMCFVVVQQHRRGPKVSNTVHKKKFIYMAKEKRFNFDGINQRWGFFFPRWGRECGI